MNRSQGVAGEIAAQVWFRRHGWIMFRSQPEAQVLAVLTPETLRSLRPFFRRLAGWGHLVLARLNRGGIADFTGCTKQGEYRACEVKEACGPSMPASRLRVQQRDWFRQIPPNSRYVGILWTDRGVFEVFPFCERGSYRAGEGER